MNFSNTTTKSVDIVPFYVYAIEGLILVLFNMFFVVVIATNRQLRRQKEYILIAGNMLFEILFGLVYLFAGIFRLRVIYEYEFMPLVTKWECFLTIHTFLSVIVTPGVGFITMITCMDRLFSVLFPLKYLKFNTKYSYGLIFVAFLLTIPTYILYGLASYAARDSDTESGLCYINNSGAQGIYIAIRIIRISASMGTVPVYVLIAFLVFRIIKRNSQMNSISTLQKSRLKRMTLTFMLITINYLACFAIPDIFQMLYTSTSSVACQIINLNKGIINIIIFMLTQEELKSAVLRTVLFKIKNSSNTTMAKMASQMISSRAFVVTSHIDSSRRPSMRILTECENNSRRQSKV